MRQKSNKVKQAKDENHSPVIPVVTFVAADHGRSVILSTTSWADPNLVTELVLR
jgi:hypothetical protein